MKRTLAFFLSGVLCAAAFCETSWCAMQIRKRAGEEAPAAAAPAEKPAEPAAAAPAPQADAPKEAAKEAPKKAAPQAAAPRPASQREAFTGAVNFVSSGKVLAEIDQAAKVGQRFTVYDSRLRRSGTLVVVKAMDKSVYLCKLTSGSAREGDRLSQETEKEAYSRVMRTKTAASLKEFLEVFPDSAYKPKIAKEMFRQTLRTSFQTFPGASITGKIVLTEKVGQEVPLGRALVKLDRFVVAMTDENGRFRIEGIPPLELPVTVKLAVRDEKFQPAEEIQVDLPEQSTAEIEKDVSLKLTPTYVSGRVVDDDGKPVKGAQVWTSPYTMEKLTDENGEYKFWRRKKLDASGAPTEGDEPLTGRDYEVYAYRQGFGAERIAVSAKSYVENTADPIRLTRQDALKEGIPALNVGLRDNLDLMQFVLSAGAGPKINQ